MSLPNGSFESITSGIVSKISSFWSLKILMFILSDDEVLINVDTSNILSILLSLIEIIFFQLSKYFSDGIF